MKTPNQYEDDRLLRDTLKHGEIVKLAAALRIKYPTFARQVNPDDPAMAGPYHDAKDFFFKAFQTRPEICLTLMADLNSSVEDWAEEEAVKGDVSHLVGDVANEVAELVCCRLDGKPAHLQRKEAMDVIAAVHKFVAGLDNESGRLREVGK